MLSGKPTSAPGHPANFPIQVWDGSSYQRVKGLGKPDSSVTVLSGRSFFSPLNPQNRSGAPDRKSRFIYLIVLRPAVCQRANASQGGHSIAANWIHHGPHVFWSWRVSRETSQNFPSTSPACPNTRELFLRDGNIFQIENQTAFAPWLNFAIHKWPEQTCARVTKPPLFFLSFITSVI